MKPPPRAFCGFGEGAGSNESRNEGDLLKRVNLPTAPLVAVVVCILGLTVAWSRALPGVFYDDGLYLLIARSLAAGQGLHYAGVPGTPAAAKYPPLFPFLLSLVWRLRPGPAAFPAFQLLNVVLAALGAGAFAAYLQRGLGYPRAFAAGVALAAWWTVDTWRYAVIPLSEPLFTLAFVFVLLAASRLERSRRPAIDTAFVLLAFAAAYYARSIGIVAGMAPVAALLLARRWRLAAALAAGVAAVMLPWWLWSAGAARTVPASLADVLGPYSAWLEEQLRASPAGFASSLVGNGLRLGSRVIDTVLPDVPAAARWVLAPPLLMLAGVGARDLWRRSRTAVLAPVFFLGALALWPFVARRLLAPVAPLLILMVAAGFLAATRVPSLRLRRLAALAGALWGLWFAGTATLRLAQRRHDDVLVSRSAELADAAAAVRAWTPPGAVIGSAELWAGIHLLTGRPVAPSALFRPVSTSGEPVWGTPARQIALWQSVGMQYLWVAPGAPVEGDALRDLARICGPGAARVLGGSQNGALVRIGLSAACRARLASSGATVAVSPR